MARYLATVLVLLAVALPSYATTNFIYPTPVWKITTHQGDEVGGGLYHMGVDVGYNLPAGTPIYAVADGIVREAQERTQFGLVVLIEHYPDDSSANVSLYGHLDPTEILVTPGQQVSVGDQIGVLGTEENNGGWAPHLHFGIHKQPYTGDWVYYGHVHDPATADEWYDPETYLPEHLIADDWDPSVTLDLVDGVTIGNTLDLTGTVGDIGGGLKKIRVKASSDGIHYETLSVDEDSNYLLSQSLNISNYPDGDFYLRVIARDQFNHKTTVNRLVTKDPYRNTTPAFLTMKSGNSNALVAQWAFGDSTLNTFFPFKESWNKGGLVAVGQIGDSDETEIVVIRNKKRGTTPLLKVMSATGDLHSSFTLRSITARATTVANHIIYVAQPLTGYDEQGEMIWSSSALNPNRTVTDIAADESTLYVCWQANGKSRISLIDLASGKLTKTFRPLPTSAATGCQITLADFTGDGTEELAVGSNGGATGTVRLFTLRGRALSDSFQPFGDQFKGVVDLSSVQWDTIEDALSEYELIVSQASKGQAWVKVYRLSNGTEILNNTRVYEETFDAGTQIVGWP